ncbi:MAG: peptide chain release factor N(5)-glutamine methyltransferase, partial [Oscillospiraceae bacterium]|nr:peptide chain release factor N(5)-glutamine methyltransferase [Oscillospiraceae bacterium]
MVTARGGTYGGIYRASRDALRRAGVSSAELEARLFAQSASGKTREEYIRDGGLPAPEGCARALRALTARRLRGEPAAYILGEWEFYSLPVFVSRETLIPRTDTETLAARATALLSARAAAGASDMRVLDLCAGTGCVGLAVAAGAVGARVTLADKYAGAVELCRKNAERNALSGRVEAVMADALSPPGEGLGAFDTIVCNPPYIPSGDIGSLELSVRGFEPRRALDGGRDGLDFFRAVARHWRGAVRRGGHLLFECGAGQAPAVRGILRENGFADVSAAGGAGGGAARRGPGAP